MNGIPIFFIHCGDCDYLRYSTAQAALTNRDSPVYLLGDDSNSYLPYVRHVHVRDYSLTANRFAGQYRHLSTNPYLFEIFCFVRWFILRDFMVLNGIEKGVYVDSDIMLYADVTRLWPLLEGFDLVLCGVVPPVHINGLTGLDTFCCLLEETYSSTLELAELQERFETMQNAGLPGGICDMTFWEIYQARKLARVLDVSRPGTGNICYDRNIQVSDGVLMEDGIKKVIWQDGFPYGTTDNGVKVRFNGLHFQGYTKNRIAAYFYAWMEGLGR